MHHSDDPSPPAAMTVGAIVLVMVALTGLAGLMQPVVRPVVDPGPFGTTSPDWTIYATVLDGIVGIGGILAAVALLRGRSTGWYGAVAVAGLTAGLGLLATLLALGAGEADGLRLLNELGGPADVARGVVVLVLLAVPDAAGHCGIGLPWAKAEAR